MFYAMSDMDKIVAQGHIGSKQNLSTLEILSISVLQISGDELEILLPNQSFNPRRRVQKLFGDLARTTFANYFN